MNVKERGRKNYLYSYSIYIYMVYNECDTQVRVVGRSQRCCCLANYPAEHPVFERINLRNSDTSDGSAAASDCFFFVRKGRYRNMMCVVC